MKTLTTTPETTFETKNYYWRIEGLVNLTTEQENKLKDDALNRMSELINEGYTSGQLVSSITDEQENEYDAYGWWSI